MRPALLVQAVAEAVAEGVQNDPSLHGDVALASRRSHQQFRQLLKSKG
jgi:hypothetical protein